MKINYVESLCLNEQGIDAKIYDHYYQRKVNPPKKPEKVGPIVDGIDVGLLRYVNEHPTWPLMDITTSEIEEKDFDYGNYWIRYYRPVTVTEKGPAVFFVHGGGFNMNTVDIYNGACRRLAELLNGVVFSVSYTLSPEGRFPLALDQCYLSIERMLAKADELFIDKDKVAVMGDSAGGNLAAALCVKDKENKYLKMQILYYPLLDQTRQPVDEFKWEFYGENICELAQDKINQLYKDSENCSRMYTKAGEDLSNPLISPALEKDYTIFPTTMILVAEYDFLTQQTEKYARKLEEAGVKVDYYLFKGAFHGFLERIGFFDQSEMSLKLVAEKIKEEFK